jgi:hypothetical protein
MRFLNRIVLGFARIINWFRRKKKLSVIKGYYIGSYVSDFPDIFENETIYLLGSPEKEWLAGMLCPCGCGEIIELVIAGNYRPSWKVEVSADSLVTLFPSVWRNVGCKSHFIVCKGVINWCDHN